MYRKLLSLFFFCLLVQTVMAVPARRGQWQRLKLADGSTISVELRGDERFHYFESADGQLFEMTQGDNVATPLTASEVGERMAKARQKRADGAATTPRRLNHYTGEKRGIIILVQYTDTKFKDGHDRELYDQIANAEGFTSSEGFVGSVSDYFNDQSRGLFNLKFDVFGPIDLANEMSYYGGNDRYGNDKHPEEMVTEAVEALKDEVDFSDYDWDGDGEVDQVFILYAGKGEANGGTSNTVWPHEWKMEEATGSRLEANGMYINTYGCSCELGMTGNIDGIGTFCHEFSHCLGFPDLYDTVGSSFGMDSWSIMDYGCYNGDGFVPCGYTSYERMAAGWIEPIELTEYTSVSGMKALTDGGEAYIVYNDACDTEYYLLENRQQTGWDAELPGSGMLILHVDYDEEIWAANTVNNTSGHQRCSVFHADNSAKRSTYSITDVAGDAYPYGDNNMLTDTSTPNASLFNANSQGTKRMGKPITDIAVSDGEVSFEFCKPASEEPSTGVLLYETFDKCAGTGGNDGEFGSGAHSSFKPDLEGWDYDKAFGAQQCARFGTGNVQGTCATPTFTLNGKAKLTFRAAPWGTDGTELSISVNGETLDSVEMAVGQWTDYSIDIEGEGYVSVGFTPVQRFFLDDVKVEAGGSSSVASVGSERRQDTRVYSLQGQYLGSDISVLGQGLYIVGGKKIVIR